MQGTTVCLLGKEFQVRKVKGNNNHVTTCDSMLIVQSKENQEANTILNRFLKQNAKDVLEDIARMMYYQFESMLETAPRICIRDMKRKWGIAHVDKGSITLNANLICYPIEFIEYIICYQFIHFLIDESSPDFNTILEKVMPDYKRRITLVDKSEYNRYEL